MLRRYTYGGILQIRQDAGSPSPGTISGPVVVYGDVAPSPHGGLGPERLAAGAWGPDVDRQPWTANLMHNRSKELGATGNGLTLTDSSAALTAEIVLPDSEAGRETAMLAHKGIVTGLSGEFDILQQYTGADGVRDVLRVSGDAVGVVQRPAYRQSTLTIRQAETSSVIIAGPAGAGKSQRARELLAELSAAGMEPFAADFQSLYAALLLLERLPDGRYPERLENQAYVLAMVESLRTTLIRFALDDDRPVVATISEPPGRPRYTALLALFGGQAREETIDPGIGAIVDRLSLPAPTVEVTSDAIVTPSGRTLSQQCKDAAERYYGPGSIREYIDQRTAANRRRRRMVS